MGTGEKNLTLLSDLKVSAGVVVLSLALIGKVFYCEMFS
jgi:hypothetical protein